ncbi:MAG: A/G-specific adenine glycosylase [Proteobacteria bacterium]|nr:A/G-specific adenine glycosylase [Pseudomonadota bacterium]MBU1711124.1 A/G-specific adenine glycosylase [Pseudomonadota bacterium]
MKNLLQFQTDLLAWFKQQSRDLPWRKTYTPYHIWLSEIMLQQTQMDRVVTYFNKWIKRFPDIPSLANGSEEEILKLWEGLGYYSRARNLRKTAIILVDNYAGTIPDTHHELLKLPGIGRYTAGAIMSLAFNREYPIVDANVERVFSRIFNIDTPIKDKENLSFIWDKATKLIPRGKARYFNQALMELGALVCNKNPLCVTCPASKNCRSYELGIVAERPVPGKSNETIFMEMATGVLIHQGKYFIQKRPKNGVWASLWEFPGGRLEPGESPEQGLIREFKEETEFDISHLTKIQTIKHNYTRYKITLHCFFCALENNNTQPTLHEAQEYQWVVPAVLDNYAFPSPHRKLIDFIREKKLL